MQQKECLDKKSEENKTGLECNFPQKSKWASLHFYFLFLTEPLIMSAGKMILKLNLTWFEYKLTCKALPVREGSMLNNHWSNIEIDWNWRPDTSNFMNNNEYLVGDIWKQGKY